jgi:hypothetical protein
MWFADLKIDQGGLVIHDLQVKNIALLGNGFQASHQRKGVANSRKKKCVGSKPLSQVFFSRRTGGDYSPLVVTLLLSKGLAAILLQSSNNECARAQEIGGEKNVTHLHGRNKKGPKEVK